MNKLLFLLALLGTSAVLSAQCLQPLNPCSPVPDTLCDLSANDPNFWNEDYWLDSLTGLHDLYETPADLHFSVVDSCGGIGAVTISFLLTLDLDGDNLPETALRSDSLPPTNTVYFNNMNGLGEARAFDQRPVPLSAKYRFSLHTVATGDTMTAALAWVSDDSAGVYTPIQLPGGRHQITWYVTADGQTDTCVHTFTVRDCQPPTMHCLFFGVDIPPPQQLLITASNLLDVAEDNVTPYEDLELSIIRSSASTGVFPLDAAGAPIPSLTIGCADVGTLNLQLWIRDLLGNTTFCETYLIVLDNFSNCIAPQGVYVDCKTEDNVGIDSVTLTLVSTHPLLQPSTRTGLTNDLGKCSIPYNFPYGRTVTLTPFKNNFPLNGVTTFDLTLMAKHILGLDTLDTPYKQIACDINRSGSITTYDIVELRKLLLGIYTDFPANTSWRFVDKAYVFPDPANPFLTSFPELITWVNPSPTPLDNNFIGVKVGDANGSAFPNYLVDTHSEDRSLTTLTLPDQLLEPGKVVDVPLYLGQAGDLLGFQLSLQADPSLLAIETATSSTLQDFTPEVFAQPEPGLLNISWFRIQGQLVPEDAPLLTLRLRALAPVRLSEGLTLAPDHLHAECYTANESVQNLQLAFYDGPLPGTSGATVFVAQPNPTSAGTNIPIRLTQAESVQVTLTDISGRILFEQRLSLPAGTHLLELPERAFPHAGIFAWQVQAGETLHTGKVVRLSLH